MAEIRNMVDARYKDTHADIKAIKDHLLKTTGSAPTTILRDENDDAFTADDAKKGESGRDRLPKLDPFGCPPSQEGQAKSANKPESTKTAPQQQQQATPTAPQQTTDKSKAVDNSANKEAEKAAQAKQKRADTLEAKAELLVNLKKEQQQEVEDVGSSKRMKMPARHVRKPPSKLKTSVDKTTAATTTATQNTAPQTTDKTTATQTTETTAPKPTNTSEHTTTKTLLPKPLIKLLPPKPLK